MGYKIDDIAFSDAIEKAIDLSDSDKVSQIVTINPEMFNCAEKDSKFAEILHSAEIVIPDGIGIKLALKLRGKSVSRIAGVDFAKELLKRCAALNYPVAIIGAKEDVISKAIENLNNEIENLNIVYYHNGYFDDDKFIYEELQRYSPKLILVAMGSPRQEYFIYNAKSLLRKCVMIGIGGSLDVWSGFVKRAPKIYQKLGIEWLYRTITQPERFKRIFPALPMFLLKSILYKKGN